VIKPDALPGILRALRHPPYRAFFAGQSISLIGTWAQTTAMGWLVWRLTQSPAMLGLITFVGRIPALIFTPAAGVIADRYPRYRLVLMAQVLAMTQAMVLASIVLFGEPTLATLAWLAGALGIITAVDIPARHAFVIELVGKVDLANAIVLNSLIFNAARIIGPMVAGGVIWSLARWAPETISDALPEGLCFLLNGLSYTVVIGLLLRIKLPRRSRPAAAGNAARDFAEALRFVGSRPALLDVLVYMGVVSTLGYTHAVIFPQVAQETFGHDAAGYSGLLSATGAGAFVGALALARGADILRSGRMIPLAGSTLGASLIVFSLTRRYEMALALMVLPGAAMLLQSTGTNAFIQLHVPDHFRGRVMGLFSVMFLGFYPIGSLLMGKLAEVLGPMSAIRLGGAVCLGGGLVLLARMPRIRASAEQLRREAEEEQAIH